MKLKLMLLSCALALLTGCGALQNMLVNMPTADESTQARLGWKRPRTAEISGTIPQDGQPTSQDLRPEVTATLETLSALNRLNPTPAAPLISLVLFASQIALTRYARRVRAERDALIEGTEAAAEKGTVKASIERVAIRRGVQQTLHRRVKKLTRK